MKLVRAIALVCAVFGYVGWVQAQGVPVSTEQLNYWFFPGSPLPSNYTTVQLALTAACASNGGYGQIVIQQGAAPADAPTLGGEASYTINGCANVTIQDTRGTVGASCYAYSNSTTYVSSACTASGSGFNLPAALLNYSTSIYVRAYGAKCDGSTDDTVAITAAYAAVPSTGANVVFPAGKCLVPNGEITITNPTATIGVGPSLFTDTFVAGIAWSEIDVSSPTAVLFTVNALTSSFQNISFNNTSGAPTAGASIYVTGSSYNQKVDYDRISTYGFYDGIHVGVGESWTLTNSVLMAYRRGLWVQNTVAPDAGDWLLQGNYFLPLSTTSESAIYIDSSGGGKIIANKVNGNPNAFSHAITLNGANPAVTSQLNVLGNDMESLSDSVIYVEQGWMGLNFDSNYLQTNCTNNCSAIYLNNVPVASYVGGGVMESGQTSTGPAVTVAGTNNGMVVGIFAQYGFASLVTPLSGTNIDLTANNICQKTGTNCPTSTTTATNLAGGALGSVPYQSAPGVTTFVASPTLVNNTPYFLGWEPSGSAVAPQIVSFQTGLNSANLEIGTQPVTGGTSGCGLYDSSSILQCAAPGGDLSGTYPNPTVAQTHIASGEVLGFSTTNPPSGANDVGFSRHAPGIVYLGNGTAGDASGTLLGAAISGGTVGGPLATMNSTGLTGENSSPAVTWSILNATGAASFASVTTTGLPTGCAQLPCRSNNWTGRNLLGDTFAGQSDTEFYPPVTITLTRFRIYAIVSANGCSTYPVLSVYDATASTSLISITFTNGTQHYDSGPVSVAVAANDELYVSWTTAAVGCSQDASLDYSIVY